MSSRRIGAIEPGVRKVRLESGCARRPAKCGMAGQHCLCDDSAVLADDPSFCGAMEGTYGIAVSSAGSGLDRDLGNLCHVDLALARHTALFHSVELGSGCAAVCFGDIHLQAGRGVFQLVAACRVAGNFAYESGTAFSDDGDSGACSASHLLGASLRVAGVERGDGVSSLLGADGVWGSDGRGDDSPGGRGIGEEVRGRVPGISREGAGGFAGSGGEVQSLTAEKR